MSGSTILDALPFPAWIDDKHLETTLYQNTISRQLWGDLIGKTIYDMDLDPWILRGCMREDWIVRQGHWLRSEAHFGRAGQEILHDKILIPLEDRILGFCIPKQVDSPCH